MNHFIISQVDLSDAKKASAECRLRLKHWQAATVKQADAKEFITDALNKISAVLDGAVIQNPPNHKEDKPTEFSRGLQA